MAEIGVIGIHRAYGRRLGVGDPQVAGQQVPAAAGDLATLGMNAEFGKNRTISSTNRRQVHLVTRNEPKEIIHLS